MSPATRRTAAPPRRRIGYAGAALALLAGLGAGWLRYRTASAELVENRRSMVEEVVRMKALILEAWWDRRDDWIRLLAEDPRLLRLIAAAQRGDRAASRALREEFDSIVRRGNANRIRIEGEDGRAVVDAGGGPVTSPVARFDRPLPPPARGRISAAVDIAPRVLELIAFTPRVETEASIVLLDDAGKAMFGDAQPWAEPMRLAPSAESWKGAPWLAEAVTVRGLGWRLIMRDGLQEALRSARYQGFSVGGLTSGGLLLLLWGVLYARLSAERRGRANQDLLAQAMTQASESIVITDAKSRIEYVNPAFCRLTGYAPEDVLGKTPRVLKSGRHDRRFYEEMWATLLRGETWQGRLVNRRKDGSLFEEDGTIAPVRDEAGTVTHFIAVKRDVSAEAALEHQLRQSQKLEAVGRLAGGVAHDFNNILTTIIGNADIALRDPASAPVADDLREILKAGRLAAELTRQLLVFSRKQRVEPRTLDAGAAVRSLEKLLRRTIDDKAPLVIEAPAAPLWASVDPTQLDQVLINLVVNARDAMPAGGRIIVDARPVELVGALTHTHGRVPPGQYALLSVQDEGTGITPEVMEHLFEPFFTTKEKGRGTGLGLATVFGIVKEARGHIVVRTALGKGTEFSIYLPMAAPPAEADLARRPEGAPPPASGTILLVEDQEEVRSVAERGLRAAGYTVLSCPGGAQALAVESGHRGVVDLLLTDVMMPGMDGRELAELLRARRPGLRVLYMSGYSVERPGETRRARAGEDLLPKPFTLTALLERVRAALARPVAPSQRI